VFNRFWTFSQIVVARKAVSQTPWLAPNGLMNILSWSLRSQYCTLIIALN